MKLKEKLAREFSGSDAYMAETRLTPNALNTKLSELEEAYLTGFEKAREMAQKRFIDKTMIRPKEKEEPNTLNTVIINGERFEISLMEDFQNLGEEQVDEKETS